VRLKPPDIEFGLDFSSLDPGKEHGEAINLIVLTCFVSSITSHSNPSTTLPLGQADQSAFARS
jgi:hypothetical protein